MNQHKIFREHTEPFATFRDRLHSALRIGRSIEVNTEDMIARFVAEYGENIFFKGFVSAVIELYDAERYQLLKPNDLVLAKLNKNKIQTSISEHINAFFDTQLSLMCSEAYFSYTVNKVQMLLLSRHRDFISNTYVLSRKIHCSKCGATYKRRNRKNNVYWVCRTHDVNTSDCENGGILENDIYSAFIRLHNKLWYNYKQILVPLQTAMQELKIHRFNGNSNVMDIHKEVAKLREQTHVLARLKTKGFLDNAKYIPHTERRCLRRCVPLQER